MTTYDVRNPGTGLGQTHKCVQVLAWDRHTNVSRYWLGTDTQMCQGTGLGQTHKCVQVLAWDRHTNVSRYWLGTDTQMCPGFQLVNGIPNPFLIIGSPTYTNKRYKKKPAHILFHSKRKRGQIQSLK